jgi:hypothetical protein
MLGLSASGTIAAQMARETRCLKKPVGVNYIWVEKKTKVKVFGTLGIISCNCFSIPSNGRTL